MRCPYCGCIDQKVLDSRPAREGEAIRRRRECNLCGRRFTTFEQLDRPRLLVVKRDGTRQPFDPEKVLKSMLIACRKRSVPATALNAAVSRIEQDLIQEFEVEVQSKAIGSRVLLELKALDAVAYIRFASVYQEFETLADFEAIVDGARQDQSNKNLVMID